MIQKHPMTYLYMSDTLAKALLNKLIRNKIHYSCDMCVSNYACLLKDSHRNLGNAYIMIWRRTLQLC